MAKKLKKDEALYKQISVYIPKHDKHFIQIVEAFIKQEYPELSMSNYIIMCIKDNINALTREQKKRFEKLSEEIAQRNSPKTSAFVDKFIGKFNGSEK